MEAIQITLNAEAGDMLVLTAEPLEPGWVKQGSAWSKVADVHDAGRWVALKGPALWISYKPEAPTENQWCWVAFKWEPDEADTEVRLSYFAEGRFTDQFIDDDYPCGIDRLVTHYMRIPKPEPPYNTGVQR